ncbi:VOC family protein [Microbacterium gorillae]|uniref:VOC family protein n=1 Tax=Microbacterium gorillae TaxID=1231063 RepID=UPI00058E78E6|nr:VOC family protein [Microbacterium gorillae]
MSIQLQYTTVLSTDVPASTAFFRDALGLTVENEVNYGDLSWITLGDPSSEGGKIVLTQPTAGVAPEVAQALTELLVAGNLPQLVFLTDDVDAAYRRAVDAKADIVQDVLEQDYGVRDFALRDPSGTAVRVQQKA